MTVPAGARLGPYEVVSPLGAGGMGEVCRRPRLLGDLAAPSAVGSAKRPRPAGLLSPRTGERRGERGDGRLRFARGPAPWGRTGPRLTGLPTRRGDLRTTPGDSSGEVRA
jgi:hypothetical protein